MNYNVPSSILTAENIVFFVVGSPFLNEFLTHLGLASNHSKQIPLALRQLKKLQGESDKNIPSLVVGLEKSGLVADNINALCIPIISWGSLSDELKTMLADQKLPTPEQVGLFREELVKLAKEAELPLVDADTVDSEDSQGSSVSLDRYLPKLTPQGMKLVGSEWNAYCIRGDYVFRITHTRKRNEKLIPIGPIVTLTKKLVPINENGQYFYVYSVGGLPVTVEDGVFGDMRAWMLALSNSGVIRPVKEEKYYRYFFDALRYSEGVSVNYFTYTPGWIMPDASKHINQAIYVWPGQNSNGSCEIVYRGPSQKNTRKILGTVESYHDEVLSLLGSNEVAYIPLLRALLAYLAPLLGITPVMLHYVAPSQSGKSSIAAVAMAATGIKSEQNARDSFVPWGSSAAYLMSVAPEFNHSYFVIDEIKNIRASTGPEVVYNLINGITSGRSNINQTAKPVFSFSAVIDSTGERLFAEQLQLKGVLVDTLDAGLFNRLADLILPTYNGSGIFKNLPSGYNSQHQLCTELCRRAMHNRGAFVEEWVQQLSKIANCPEELAELKKEFLAYSEKLINPYLDLMPDSLNILTTFTAVDFVFRLAVRKGLLKPKKISLSASEGDFFKCLMKMFEAARNVTGSIDAFENNVLKKVRELLSNPGKHDFSCTTTVNGVTSHITKNPERIVVQETNTNEGFNNEKTLNFLEKTLPTYSTRFFLTKREIKIIFNAPTEALYKRVMEVLVKYRICKDTAGVRFRTKRTDKEHMRIRFHEFFYSENDETLEKEPDGLGEQLELPFEEGNL